MGSGRRGPSLDRSVVHRADATATSCRGDRRTAATPPVVESSFPAPGRVSRKVLLVHLCRQGVAKGQEVFATY